MYLENYETNPEMIDGAYLCIQGSKAVIRALGIVYLCLLS